LTDQESQTPAQEPVEPEAETGAANEVDNDLTQLYDQVQSAIDERDQLKDQLLRTMADFQNFRKRVLDEKKQLEERAIERFVVSLLPVLDNFERGMASVEAGADPASVIEGVRAIERQFRSVLDTQKVVRIKSVGEPFDPDQHEALATVSSEEHPEDTVVDEIEAGYKIGERVIRPARVRVTKRP